MCVCVVGMYLVVDHLYPVSKPTATHAHAQVECACIRSVVECDTALEHVVCAAAGVPGHARQADSYARQGELVQGLLHANTL
jgi:hypothetical protein